jgi:hypothetical protein
VKLDGGQGPIHSPNFDLGDLRQKGYVGFRVQSIKGTDGHRDYIASIDTRIDQQNKTLSGQWEEWLRVNDNGDIADGACRPVNNRSWHNWLRLDGSQCAICYYNVTDT